MTLYLATPEEYWSGQVKLKIIFRICRKMWVGKLFEACAVCQVKFNLFVPRLALVALIVHFCLFIFFFFRF